MEKIDFVLIWVDGNEPKWKTEFLKYSPLLDGDKREVRFRDWGTLKYWFRGVEKFAPWVNKVHFVTCGHIPDWLNLKAPKLNFVKHSDYIPAHYLPTFNSHTIELNLHRIQGLAEHFVYFNDDTFITNNIKEDFYFKNGMPVDMAIINPITTSQIGGILLNDTNCINKHFKKNEVIKKSFFKWFNYKYGALLLRTINLMPWNAFAGFYDPHLPNAFLKSTFEEIWEKEYDLLDKTCHSRFRENSNVNQYLMRYWQLVTSQFYPVNTTTRSIVYRLGIHDLNQIMSAIKCKKKQITVLNDDVTSNFESIKDMLISSFDTILPNKSSFEK